MSRKLRVFLLLALALSFSAVAGITITPYVQNPGKDTMTIMWETDSKDVSFAAVSHPDMGRNITEMAKPAEPETVKYKENANDPESPEQTRYIYTVKLIKLKPDTTYSYYVNSGNEKSKQGMFTTFPETSDKFTFIAYGDTRSNPDIHREIVYCFAQHNPAFIIHTGDMVSTGGAYQEWSKEFFGPLRYVINHVPIFLARGNHEGSGADMKRLFTPPDDKFYYSFDYGDAHFTCLDMDESPEAVKWAEDDLSKSKAKWKFVFYHYPNFNIGGHGSDWARKTLVPLFRKYGVDFALSGHSHVYERFYPLRPFDDDKASPVTYIVTGGGGAPLYDVKDHPCLAKYANENHFLVFNVAGDTLKMDAYNKKNELLDSFTVTKKDGKDDAAYLASAKPEELDDFLKLYNAVDKNLNAAVSKLPSADASQEVTYEFDIPDLKKNMDIELSLSEESQKNYTSEPVVGKATIEPGKKGAVVFKVKAKSEVKADKEKLSPVLSFGCKFRIAGFEKTIEPHPVIYRPSK